MKEKYQEPTIETILSRIKGYIDRLESLPKNEKVDAIYILKQLLLPEQVFKARKND